MPPRMALFLPEPQNPYQQAMAAEAEAACRRHGFVLATTAFAESAGGDLAHGQVRQIHAAVHAPAGARPDAILVMPVQEAALRGLMETAVASGIGVLFLNRAGDVTALREQARNVPVGFVTPDHRDAGRLQGRQVAAWLGGAGNVMYVRGRASNASAEERAAGFHAAVAESRLQIATTLEGNWNADVARSYVEKWLRTMLPARYKVDAIASQSDLMASGILEGLRALAAEMKRPDIAAIPVFGLDGVESVGRRMVDEGALAATVILPPTVGKALDLLAGRYAGRTVFPPKVVLPAAPYPPDSVALRGTKASAAIPA
jgi:ABC-type sugar transport system substrate-binding protein